MANGSMNAGPGASKAAWGKRSSYSWLGIDERVSQGTIGSRHDGSAEKYGGESIDGRLFKGNSAKSPTAETNSGKSSEKQSSKESVSGSYGPGSGTVGSREQMPKYGRETNKGKLTGAGANATKQSSDKIYRGGPVASTSDVVRGTNNDRESVARGKIGGKSTGKTRQ